MTRRRRHAPAAAATPTTPATVPAVFDTPSKIPAYLGAMSKWFTANPALANAHAPRAADEQRTAPRMECRCGMMSNATAAAANPTVLISFRVPVTEKIRWVMK